MITVTANTLAAAIFRASIFIHRGAVVTRCLKTPGPHGQWFVKLSWGAQQPTEQTPAQVAGAE